jgi:RHS repeat-associated protein
VVTITATDYSSNSRTNRYQVVITNNSVARTLTYDLNGNETSVVTATATNTYEWDAADRLVAINSGINRSEFTYDGLGRRVRIVEKVNGVAQNTNLFLWCSTELCEQRDSTGGTVIKRFFGRGEQMSGTNYYFTRDHLGSVREMTDGTGAIRARYEYDPYGRRTKVSGDFEADFAFTGHYYHPISGLYLTLYRAYDSDTSRWLSRDPIGERGGVNEYSYVSNQPLVFVDPMGLSDYDVALIADTSQRTIDQMTGAGERSGSGSIGGWLNNLSRLWRWKHLGCGEQSDVVLADLLDDAYDDDWRFSIVTVLGPLEHQFIVAHSDNPGDPTLIIDPLRNTIQEVTTPMTYRAILISSDTFVKPSGNRGAHQLNAFRFY